MPPFLIIGGYGTVGSLAVNALRKFQPELPLAVAGRDAAKATAAASLHSNVVGFAVDTTREDLGLPVGQVFSGVAVLTNDLSTHPALFAARHRIPYTSIATQLNHLGPKLALHAKWSSDSASLILDTSFAGVLILAGLHIATRFEKVLDIEIGVLMDEKDLGGPASLADVGDFDETPPGLVLSNSNWQKPTANQEKRMFSLIDGTEYTGTSFPSVDIPDIAAAISPVSARLDFTYGVSPGSRDHGSPSVEIVYDIDGILPGGQRDTIKAQLSHQKGQTALTALGVAVAIEMLAGKVTGRAVPAGIYMPSSLIPADHMFKRLQEGGASFN